MRCAFVRGAVFLCIVLTAAIHAETRRVTGVRVEGAPRGIRLLPELAAGDTLDMAMLEQSGSDMARQLMAEGFLCAEVTFETSQDSSGVAVCYRVKPGLRAKVARWQVTGGDSIAGRALHHFLPGPGMVFSKRNLDRAVAGLLAVFEGAGFPAATVAAVSVRDSAGLVIPELSVSAGPLVIVDFLEFSGSGRLSVLLLTRLARFRPGRKYAPGLVAFWRSNLEGSRVVTVGGSEIVKGDGYGIRFSVCPAKTSRVLGAVGYDARDRAITGSLELNLDNLLDTGRRLAAGWRAFAGRKSWFLSYAEPWVFVPWLSATAAAQHEVFDTTGSSTSLSIQAGLATEAGFSISLTSGYDQVVALDTSGRSSTVWAGTGIGIDTRPAGLNPRTGAFLGLRTTGGNRASLGSGHFIGRFEGDAGFLWPSVGSFVLSSTGHYRLVYSKVPLSRLESYRLGGAATLRGYNEDQFSGEHLAWLNSELHWQADSRVVGYPFFDVGVCDIGERWIVRTGYGFGLRAATGMGILEVDYGIGFMDSPVHGKVHLGFQAEF